MKCETTDCPAAEEALARPGKLRSAVLVAAMFAPASPPRVMPQRQSSGRKSSIVLGIAEAPQMSDAGSLAKAEAKGCKSSTSTVPMKRDAAVAFLEADVDGNKEVMLPMLISSPPP